MKNWREKGFVATADATRDARSADVADPYMHTKRICRSHVDVCVHDAVEKPSARSILIYRYLTMNTVVLASACVEKDGEQCLRQPQQASMRPMQYGAEANISASM